LSHTRRMSMSNPQQSVSFTSNDLLHAKAHPITCARRRQLSVFRAGGGHGNSGSPRGTLSTRRALAAFGAILTLSAPGSVHDYWADGKAIPNWVKASCWGPADAHHLRPDQVRRVSDDYYEVDGYRHRVPFSRALPSQDADYWIFYRDNPSRQSGIYCLRSDGLLMRDPAPQEIKTVCRTQDAGKPIVRASRMPSGWPNDAVADRRGEGPVGDDGAATVSLLETR
jgi:hypothetical protein